MSRAPASAFALLASWFSLASLRAAEAGGGASLPLVTLSSDAAEKRLVPAFAQVTVTRSTDAAGPGAVVTVRPSEHSYPGIALKPESNVPWDLSRYGHVSVRITNTGPRPILATARVDDANRTESEMERIKPGGTGTITVWFGYNHRKPALPFDARAVTEVLVFTGNAAEAYSYRIESIAAGGSPGEKPPVLPDEIRVRPRGGVLLGVGIAASANRSQVRGGAEATFAGSSLQIVFPPGTGEQSITVQPTEGRWDLRGELEMRVKVRNAGTAPLVPRVQLQSNDGPGNTVAADSLAPGAETEIVVPFAADQPVNVGDKPGIYRFSNDTVSGVTLGVEPANVGRTLVVESITADVPSAPVLPAWLGRRPPVDGDWIQTLDQNFDGPALDPAVWNATGSNFWDKNSHLSPQEVILENGVARLRFEKKTGHENEDPANPKVNGYACGYLDTFGKWTQRYGYFEARMKLPQSPGLAPAFWLMPDRGGSAPQWVRADTARGGMEFDIMEFLSRWGSYRYNIAMHWDGYGKAHQATGSEHNYVQPDKDGFITAGLLWTPGSAIYYGNGREIVRWENPRVSSVPSDIMFTHVAGGWDNDVLDDARLPDDFVIDYVRAWQRRDLSSEADTWRTVVKSSP